MANSQQAKLTPPLASTDVFVCVGVTGAHGIDTAATQFKPLRSSPVTQCNWAMHMVRSPPAVHTQTHQIHHCYLKKDGTGKPARPAMVRPCIYCYHYPHEDFPSVGSTVCFLSSYTKRSWYAHTQPSRPNSNKEGWQSGLNFSDPNHHSTPRTMEMVHKKQLKWRLEF